MGLFGGGDRVFPPLLQGMSYFGLFNVSKYFYAELVQQETWQAISCATKQFGSVTCPPDFSCLLYKFIPTPSSAIPPSEARFISPLQRPLLSFLGSEFGSSLQERRRAVTLPSAPSALDRKSISRRCQSMPSSLRNVRNVPMPVQILVL